MSRLDLPALSLAFLLAAACGAPTERPPQPPAPASVQAELGYRDVIRAGEEYARLQGYELSELGEVVEVRPNYWRVRFGLAPRGSGQILDLEFDGATRAVVREEIIIIPTE